MLKEKMFRLFKRTKIESWEIELLCNTIEKLPNDYSDLVSQIEDGLFRGVLLDASNIAGYVAFTFNHDILRKYENRGDKDYKLTDIKVYDIMTMVSLPYEIYVSSGTICGYSLGGGKKRNIDVNNIDVSMYRKELVGESGYDRINALLDDVEKEVVSPSEVYSVFVSGKEYFHLKDLEDGDFIGMDAKKVIYKITHDPMVVQRIDQTLIEILG